MKATTKNAGFAKALLLNHGEKLAIALAVGAAAWLLWGSLGAEGESRQPAELSRQASSANQSLLAFTASQAPSLEEDPTNAVATADTWKPIATTKITVDEYQTDPLGWAQPPVKPIVLRSDPTLLAARHLEGFGATAPLATMDEATRKAREIEQKKEEQKRARDQQLARERADDDPDASDATATATSDGRRRAPAMRSDSALTLTGDERIDLASFACVTALAPIEEQYELYQQAFANARGYDANRDQPEYLGYFVERMEVGASGEDDWRRVPVLDVLTKKTFDGVSANTITAATSGWATGVPNLADRRYTHPAMTFPLPPVVGMSLGRKVVHSEVPLQAEADAEQAAADRAAGAAPVAGEPSAVSIFSTGGAAAAAAGRSGAPRGAYATPLGAGGVASRGGAATDYVFTVPQVMLRFFDFTVQPGKRYRYRVKLLLRDPNAKDLVSANDLDKETKQRVEDPQNRAPYLAAEWSEPSKIISIPAAGEVFMADVRTATSRSLNGEPVVDLLVKSYDIDSTKRVRQGEQIMTFHRGALLNRTVEDIEVLQPPDLLRVASYAFKTNVTLLDARGGDKLTRDTTAPGRVLLMDSSGRMFVEDAHSSKDALARHKAVFLSDDDAGGAAPAPSAMQFDIR